jgi:hypothetical protein
VERTLSEAAEARRPNSPSLITITQPAFRAPHPAFMNDYSGGSESSARERKKVASKLIVSPISKPTKKKVESTKTDESIPDRVADLFAKQIQPLLLPITQQSDIFEGLVGKFRQQEAELEPLSEAEDNDQVEFPSSVGVETFPEYPSEEEEESDDEGAVVITTSARKIPEEPKAVVTVLPIRRVELANDVVAGILRSRGVRIKARKREFEGVDRDDKDALDSFLDGRFYRLLDEIARGKIKDVFEVVFGEVEKCVCELVDDVYLKEVK